jgi:hypothetical protein
MQPDLPHIIFKVTGRVTIHLSSVVPIRNTSLNIGGLSPSQVQAFSSAVAAKAFFPRQHHITI